MDPTYLRSGSCSPQSTNGSPSSWDQIPLHLLRGGSKTPEPLMNHKSRQIRFIGGWIEGIENYRGGSKHLGDHQYRGASVYWKIEFKN